MCWNSTQAVAPHDYAERLADGGANPDAAQAEINGTVFRTVFVAALDALSGNEANEKALGPWFQREVLGRIDEVKDTQQAHGAMLAEILSLVSERTGVPVARAAGYPRETRRVGRRRRPIRGAARSQGETSSWCCANNGRNSPIKILTWRPCGDKLWPKWRLASSTLRADLLSAARERIRELRQERAREEAAFAADEAAINRTPATLSRGRRALWRSCAARQFQFRGRLWPYSEPRQHVAAARRGVRRQRSACSGDQSLERNSRPMAGGSVQRWMGNCENVPLASLSRASARARAAPQGWRRPSRPFMRPSRNSLASVHQFNGR